MLYIYICIHACVCVYIYIYIHKLRTQKKPAARRHRAVLCFPGLLSVLFQLGGNLSEVGDHLMFCFVFCLSEVGESGMCLLCFSEVGGGYESVDFSEVGFVLCFSEVGGGDNFSGHMKD